MDRLVSTVTDERLLQAYGGLRLFEYRFQSRIRERFRGPVGLSAHINGLRYRLASEAPGPVWRAVPANQQVKLASQLAVAGVLRLRYRWVEMPQDLPVDWSYCDALDGLSEGTSIRVGLATLAQRDDMCWSHGDPREPDGRVPFRCSGCQDEKKQAVRLRELLQGAYKAGVHLLLLPELTVDDGLLSCLQEWLETNNMEVPVLRLVVAGSRHVSAPGGQAEYRNRCTVLGYAGDVLWNQDKLSPFVFEGEQIPEEFRRAGCTIGFEPSDPADKLVLRDTLIGTAIVLICLDFLEWEFAGSIPCHLYLVPAMTPSLSRFRDRSRALGGRHGAASLVCNAKLAGAGKDRCLAYVPRKGGPSTPFLERLGRLFTLDIPFRVK